MTGHRWATRWTYNRHHRRYCSARMKALNVQRIHTEKGSHIEPPLDELWTNHEKLRWHLAVVLHDLRLPADLVSIEPGHLTVGAVTQESYVLVLPLGRLITTGGYFDAWRLITAMEIGVWVTRSEIAA